MPTIKSNMSSGQQQSPSANEIRDEVRRTIQQLSELARTERDFDQFCETVLINIVKITGAHGAMLWQVAQGRPSITHQHGKFPHQTAREIVSPENPDHTRAVAEVITKKLPMGVSSEAFTGRPTVDQETASQALPFLLLFAPVLDRSQNCQGTIELLQRGDISPQAQEGYLRFLTQVSQLFQRWHEQQDLAKLSHNVDQWEERRKFINETHRYIDPTETAYAIANEARRLLRCDRVSVGQWNGRRCKITAISSQDRFDNRANVVRLLSNVATASVSADTPFWIVGDTEGIAPEVARKINEYLDEAHSRTLAVIPLMSRPPQLPDLEMRSRRKEKPTKLGVLIIEYFESDVLESQIEEDCKLIIEQSELALDNARKHSQIFLQPVWKRLGWLQHLLFRDHLSKTLTGLAALTILMLMMIFWPWELKMKVDGVMHPATRRAVFSPPAQGVVEKVHVKQHDRVDQDEPLIELVDLDLNRQIQSALTEMEVLKQNIRFYQSQIVRADDLMQKEEMGNASKVAQNNYASLQRQLKILEDKRAMLVLRSPIKGTVLSSRETQELLGRPPSPGEPLLQVADLDGPWQLELKIPEGRVGYVDEAIQAADGPLDG